jgi:hypothetical protein
MNEREFRNLYNEGADGYVPTDPREIELDRELAALRAEWTVEVTQARRAAWNAEMIAAKKAGRKVSIPATEQKLRFCFCDLKRAIAKHNL